MKWDYFVYSESGEEKLTYIDLWAGAPPESLVTRFLFFRRVNYQSYLLEKGLARLKPDITAPQELEDAQEYAKWNKLGMWAEPEEPPPEEVPDLGDEQFSPENEQPPTDEEAEPPAVEAEKGVIGQIFAFLKKPEGIVALVGTIVTVLFGVQFGRWMKHYRLNLIFLGEPSTGKTWLYSRLVERNISVQRLMELKQTDSRKRAQTEELPMGQYRASPTFTDLPGSKPGQHLREILGGRVREAARRTFFRRRPIWVIVLSTTEDARASWDSTETMKFQSDFVSRQLGYLRLPQAVLADPDVPNPSLVLICIAKVDLFLKHDPNDSDSVEGITRLRKHFGEHIRLIKSECGRQRVPFEVLYVSALKGWGIYDLEQAIRRSLFVRSL